jgi:RNA polymerase sigma factor (TIGR02999 family)
MGQPVKKPFTPEMLLTDSDVLHSEVLFSAVYDHLRRIAYAHMVNQGPGQTLDPTGLVHEAWLKLRKSEHGQTWQDKRHFYRAVAVVMWQILIDRSRRRQRERHGGGLNRANVDLGQISDESSIEELLLLEPALSRLNQENPELAELVQLRFFVGLTYEEISELQKISVACVRRQWIHARTRLYRYLQN